MSTTPRLNTALALHEKRYAPFKVHAVMRALSELGVDIKLLLAGSGLQPWAVMAFNNLVMSYVTMAPMYRDLLGQDPFSEAALENQLKLIKTLLQAVFEYRPGGSSGIMDS